MADSDDYSAVPPPPSLTAGNPNINFNDALSKARAIAEKLKQNKDSAPSASSPTTSQKRGYEDSYHSSSNSGYDRRSSRDNDYHYDRESKRGAYDKSHSYDSHGSGRDNHRYGLGSEERKHSSYGPPTSQHVHKEEFGVPNSVVGLVIGKGGENLKRIEAASGARIQFGPDEGESERRCNITGEEDQIQVARDMVMQVVTDASATDARRGGGGGGAYSAYGSGGNTVTVNIPGNKVGLVIGSGGETIRSLESQSGAKIAITQENPGERSYERTINITGNEEAIARAKALIDDVVNPSGGYRGGDRDYNQSRQGGGYDDYQRPYRTGANAYGSSNDSRGGGYRGPGGHRPQPGEENDSINVPQTAVGLIIGKGGETIRGLEQESGARIKVDQATSGAEERKVLLFGSPDAIALAKQLIQDKVSGNRDGGHGRYGGGGGYNNRGYDRGYGQQSGYGTDAATSSGTSGAGYDYSQYYGYYNQGSGEAGDNAQYYQGYQYPYGSYSQYPPPAAEDATKSEKDASKPAGEGEGGGDQVDASKGESQTDDQNAAAAAYYAQYYGQSGQPQDAQYYQQYYQQYYSQYPGYESSAPAAAPAAASTEPVAESKDSPEPQQ
ncbi:hypothetical protein BGW37DRAFT_499391 [Umbelopsis sp. PMI_123]|nr:hypothetical protein BGW37DRAFT_499391 [Umbelopsis sp. PMI_123]